MLMMPVSFFLGSFYETSDTFFQHPVALFWIAIMLSSITFGVISITSAWGIDFDQIAVRIFNFFVNFDNSQLADDQYNAGYGILR